MNRCLLFVKSAGLPRRGLRPPTPAQSRSARCDFWLVFGKISVETEWTGTPRFVIRNLRIPMHRLSFSLPLGPLSGRVTADLCFRTHFSENPKFLEIPIWGRFFTIFDSFQIHWTFPNAALVGLGLGGSCGAKHSLPGDFCAKNRRQKCKVTIFSKHSWNI